MEIFTKIKECEISPSLDEELSSIYVSWEDSGPKLMVGPLLEDILKDLNVRVMTGTEKDLALYETKTGTYAIGRSAIRLIIKEVINRVKSDGDLVLECVTPQNISKIKSLAPALSIEVGNEFQTMLFLLCVGNGVVDLRIPYLIDWSPDYYMVQSTPVKYIPDKDWRELAPTFAKALERTFDGCLDRIEYFQR